MTQPRASATVGELEISHAERRAAAMNLSNIRTFCGAIGDYSDSFDLALALHSCGGAADAVQAAAIKAGNQSSQSSPQLDFQGRISSARGRRRQLRHRPLLLRLRPGRR